MPEPDVPEPDVPEPDVPELDVPEPELLLEEVPELAEVPADESDEEVLCVDPGRVSATTPTAATLARVTVVVAERTLDRPRVPVCSSPAYAVPVFVAHELNCALAQSKPPVGNF